MHQQEDYTLPNCKSIKSKSITPHFTVLQGYLPLRDYSVSGIITGPIGLKVWTKIFRKPSVKEVVNKCNSLKDRVLLTEQERYW